MVVHEAKIHDVVYDDIRPRQPENDIDVYLSPLIKYLTKLWDGGGGVVVFNGYQNETFKLCAMLFCTINDFPAYENLSGYNVKGPISS